MSPNSNNLSNNVLPPWPKNKRVKVALVATVLILAVSIGIGWLGHTWGRQAGVFESGDILGKLQQQLDPAAQKAGLEFIESQYTKCVFADGNQMLFSPDWKAVNNSCAKLGYIDGNTKSVTVRAKMVAAAKETVLTNQISQVTDLVTMQFNHPAYMVTQIVGRRDGLAYKGYVIAVEPYKSVIIEYYGGDSNTDLWVDSLVTSIEVR